jgi:membrane-bound lytic murein transglycosylase A
MDIYDFLWYYIFLFVGKVRMMRNIKYGILSIILGLVVVNFFYVGKQEKSMVKKTESSKKEIKKPHTIIKFTPLPSQKPAIVSKNTLKQCRFNELEQWNETDMVGSLNAFRNSCQLWMHQSPSRRIGNSQIPMKVSDWLPICQRVMKLPKDLTQTQAKTFFETYFQPYHWKRYRQGLFTGYYSPTVEGSAVKTDIYKTPLYDAPQDLVSANLHDFTRSNKRNKNIYGHVISRRLKPYFSREQIYNGALKNRAKVIAWLKSPIDAMLLEIEGSGVVETPKGEQIFLGYSCENGRKYNSIFKLMIDSRIFKRSNATIKAIKNYFKIHPRAVNHYVSRNPSYVFFTRYSFPNFKGAQNVVLTPKYSLAVDRRYVPYGVPLFLKTKYPVNEQGDTKMIHRVMIAQDTGGAIRGPIRGDIYWGTGSKAMKIADLMSSRGDYWLLLPKHFRLV